MTFKISSIPGPEGHHHCPEPWTQSARGSGTAQSLGSLREARASLCSTMRNKPKQTQCSASQAASCWGPDLSWVSRRVVGSSGACRHSQHQEGLADRIPGLVPSSVERLSPSFSLLGASFISQFNKAKQQVGLSRTSILASLFRLTVLLCQPLSSSDAEDLPAADSFEHTVHSILRLHADSFGQCLQALLSKRPLCTWPVGQTCSFCLPERFPCLDNGCFLLEMILFRPFLDFFKRFPSTQPISTSSVSVIQETTSDVQRSLWFWKHHAGDRGWRSLFLLLCLLPTPLYFSRSSAILDSVPGLLKPHHDLRECRRGIRLGRHSR